MEAAGTTVKGKLGWLEVSQARDQRKPEAEDWPWNTPQRALGSLCTPGGTGSRSFCLGTPEWFSAETDVRGVKREFLGISTQKGEETFKNVKEVISGPS